MIGHFCTGSHVGSCTEYRVLDSGQTLEKEVAAFVDSCRIAENRLVV
jgi:hypothetical protein